MMNPTAESSTVTATPATNGIAANLAPVNPALENAAPKEIAPFAPVNPANLSIDELLAKHRKELEMLEELQRREEDRKRAERREKLLELPILVGLEHGDLGGLLLMIRAETSTGKAKRIISDDKKRLHDSLRKGLTAADAKKHFGISPATYYKEKRALGLTQKYNYTQPRGPKSRAGASARK